jgi:hypothetical protein
MKVKNIYNCTKITFFIILAKETRRYNNKNNCRPTKNEPLSHPDFD